MAQPQALRPTWPPRQADAPSTAVRTPTRARAGGAPAPGPGPRQRLGELPPRVLAARLASGRLMLRCGPFTLCLRSPLPAVAEGLALAYAGFELAGQNDFADFHVALLPERGVRRWWRPQARFWLDHKPSMPLAAGQAFAMLEWGLNWCVASHAHQYLVMHAAVVEKNGQALLLPAPSGAGKSTLCAALVHRGWRLLSDELALLDMASGQLHGMARPVNLKNGAIEVIRAFAPEAVLSPPVPGTIKGTVALMRAPDDAVRRVDEPARPAWIVLPRWQADAAACLQPHSAAQAFMLLAGQGFNYGVHGLAGFEALSRLVDACSCQQLVYGRLDDALRCLDALAAGQATAGGLS